MADEGAGEVHGLVVFAVRPPDGQFDDGELDYEILHPVTCRQEPRWDGMVLDYTCDVAERVSDCGLEFCLNYSHTPVTRPGTYRIQAWWRKETYWDTGDEWDAGIEILSRDRSLRAWLSRRFHRHG